MGFDKLNHRMFLKTQKLINHLGETPLIVYPATSINFDKTLSHEYTRMKHGLTNQLINQ